MEKANQRLVEQKDQLKQQIANTLSSSAPSKVSDRTDDELLDQIRNDFGQGMQEHVMNLEKTVDMTNFLTAHKVGADYRAKMVDWMVEVLSTFKCSDHSFFKAIQVMDRFYAEAGQPQSTSSLHLSGVVAMFIATKYEDIIPLLMRTIVNKVGHGKFDKLTIQNHELKMLKTIKFKLGAPTVIEHLERMSADLGIAQNKPIQIVFNYLAKLALHNYELSQLSASELAGAVAYVGLKICDKKSQVKSDQALKKLEELCQIDIKAAKVNGRFLLTMAKTFEKDHPSLKNLRTVYSEDLKQI